jgi:hypothetical protein
MAVEMKKPVRFETRLQVRTPKVVSLAPLDDVRQLKQVRPSGRPLGRPPACHRRAARFVLCCLLPVGRHRGRDTLTCRTHPGAG